MFAKTEALKKMVNQLSMDNQKKDTSPAKLWEAKFDGALYDLTSRLDQMGLDFNRYLTNQNHSVRKEFDGIREEFDGIRAFLSEVKAWAKQIEQILNEIKANPGNEAKEIPDSSNLGANPSDGGNNDKLSISIAKHDAFFQPGSPNNPPQIQTQDAMISDSIAEPSYSYSSPSSQQL